MAKLVERIYVGPQIATDAAKSESTGGGVPTVAVAKHGGLAYTNGVISNDPNTGEIVAGDIRVQTRRVLESLKLGLERAGTGFEHVLMVQAFIKTMDDWAAYHDVYLEYFPENAPPPRFTVTADMVSPSC